MPDHDRIKTGSDQGGGIGEHGNLGLEVSKLEDGMAGWR